MRKTVYTDRDEYICDMIRDDLFRLFDADDIDRQPDGSPVNENIGTDKTFYSLFKKYWHYSLLPHMCPPLDYVCQHPDIYRHMSIFVIRDVLLARFPVTMMLDEDLYVYVSSIDDNTTDIESLMTAYGYKLLSTSVSDGRYVSKYAFSHIPDNLETL